MQKKVSFGKIMVLGFALFAMFFGAGNLIFPPKLGATCGGSWFSGFLMYILIDAGLAVTALLAFVRAKGDFMAESARQLTPKTAFLLTFLNTLCLGPLIAIPRTAATTFDIAVKPLLGGASWTSWVFGVVYFGIVAFLCIRPGKVVDIIGKILSPVMLVALLALIVIGVISPLGPIEAGVPTNEAVSSGLEAGYQTMDMLGALLLGVVALLSVRESGVTEEKQQIRTIFLGGLIAAAGLFVVYGGLSYLGATVSGYSDMVSMEKTALLTEITHQLVGNFGTVLLGVIVAAACLTTSIGLVSSCAQNFNDITGGKMAYKPTMFAIIVFSYLLSNLGTEQIVNIAAPILAIIFPIYIMLVLLSFFPMRVREHTYAPPFGAGLAFIVAVLIEMDACFSVSLFGTRFDLYANELPLSNLGLGWLIPSLIAALIGGLIGAAVPRNRAEVAGKSSEPVAK